MGFMKKTPPQVEIYADPPALFRAAAEKFVQIANEAVQAQGKFFVVLAGGNTPRELYLLLAQENWQSRVPWGKTHVFFGDERCVPPDHADSNFRMAREALLDKLSLPESNIHRMRGEDAPDAAATAYAKEIPRVFGVEGNKLPRFDLILLGLGNDGHTASLFPGTAALHENQQIVVANFVEKFKSYRLTLTLPAINNAKEIVFLVSGESKAEIIYEIFNALNRPVKYPAELVQPASGRLLWLLDRAAASKLSKTR
jgi:6-phosphogluconolactonase